MEFIKELFARLETTEIHKQVSEVDIVGLFSNPWFLVPFLLFVGYSLWRQSWFSLLFVALCVFLWWGTGTEYMQDLVSEDGELNQGKILPLVGIGAGVALVLGLIIFGRSE